MLICSLFLLFLTSPADKTFCEMVKSNKLCEKKLFVQFCCQTCLMAG